MCDLCLLLEKDAEHAKKIQDLYKKINERLNATKEERARKTWGETWGEEVAFTTPNFPLATFALFEPRMPLQLPSNFYQPIVVDGKKLRSDWASGWIRAVGFKDDNLYLIAHAMRTSEAKEYLIYLHMVEFKNGEYRAKEEGNKIVISVNEVKEGIDLIADKPTKHTYSFSFVHHPTERAALPRDRIETSALVKSVYHGKLPQRPLVFDWTEYVITVPHFAPYSIIHQNYKNYGYKSPMEMQNAVTNFLKQHLNE